jgi:hypothetical protein
MVTAWKRSCSESMLAVDKKWGELFDMLARAVTFVDRVSKFWRNRSWVVLIKL